MSDAGKPRTFFFFFFIKKVHFVRCALLGLELGVRKNTAEIGQSIPLCRVLLLNGGLAHYVIAAAAVASHNVKHAWVLAWVASRFAASSCHLRFSHFAIVLQFS